MKREQTNSTALQTHAYALYCQLPIGLRLIQHFAFGGQMLHKLAECFVSFRQIVQVVQTVHPQKLESSTIRNKYG